MFEIGFMEPVRKKIGAETNELQASYFCKRNCLLPFFYYSISISISINAEYWKMLTILAVQYWLFFKKVCIYKYIPSSLKNVLHIEWPNKSL